MSNPEYLLNRDAKETARLIAQHDWLKQLVGCNIHPSIPIPNTSMSSLRIADVATGTAIWLLDLANTLPSSSTTEFYGFDISTKQFPAPEDRPANVFLYEHNVLNPFPEEYHGTFDVVAVRLITAGLRTSDWETAIENLCTLLKPGGHLQWIEPIHSSLQVLNSLPGAPNAATRQAVQLFLDAYRKTLYPGPLQVPDLCRKHGLDEVALEVFPSDRFPDHEKVRSQGKDFLSGVCTAMMGYIVGDGSTGLTEEKVKDVVKRSMEELNGDLFLRSEMQFVVCRKPSSPA